MEPTSRADDNAMGGVPRYRVEHRVPTMATLIVGFADTPREYRSLVAVAAGRLLRQRAGPVWAVGRGEADADG